MVDTHTQDMLSRFGFDAESFKRLQAELKKRGLDETLAKNVAEGSIEPPDKASIYSLPPMHSEERKELFEEGSALVRNGKVGAVILAGGMATRFGGVVKATVDVANGKSFLDLKVESVSHCASCTGGSVPVFLMTSFATHNAVAAQLTSLESTYCKVQAFPQHLSLRLHPDGRLFREGSSEALYAPGHGDLGDCLRESGILKSFQEQGGELLFVSNVDNLTATLDPALLALHRRSFAEVSVEVVAKKPGDSGGAPASYQGRTQIIEAFRFPSTFDQNSIPVFNTNTFIFEAKSLNQAFPLDWFVAQKKVEGEEVVQFERLAGQLTAFLKSNYIQVQREGADARFHPIKDPAALEKDRDAIMHILKQRAEELRSLASYGTPQSS